MKNIYGTLDIKIDYINGSDIKWSDKEVAILKSEIGKVENTGEEAPLHWVVFANGNFENAKAFATALCLLKDVQKVVGNSE